MSRRQRRSAEPRESPTYRRILDESMSQLREDGFDRFNLQRVLDDAEVSRATVYRHFTDVDGLLEAALIETFRQEVDRYTRLVIDIVEQAADISAFRASLRLLLQNFSTIPASVRLQRAHTIALASTRPELAGGVAPVQEALTDGWEAVIRLAQSRGYVRADIDSRATAVHIQAMTLGRIVDDAALSHLDNERWATYLYEFIDRAMLVPAS